MAKRVLSLFMVFVMLLEFLPMTAWAAWDGSGDVSGSAGDVSGKYWVYDGSDKDIVGYRFSIYDEYGVKQGVSVAATHTCQYI